MLRKYTYILAFFSLLGFTAGCSDELATGQTAADSNGLTLQLVVENNEENAATRTDLENADAKNNVQKVQIYIFKGTGNTATYVSQDGLEWTPDDKSKSHTLNATLESGQTYTLLGVGLDKESEDTYAITDKNDTGLSLTTTLANVYAKLKEEKTQADIAQSEFFTGTVSFTYTGKDTSIDVLELRRRVAGVMLYVTDIPQNLYKENDTYRTTKVYVKLGSNQKKSVRLKRDFNAENWEEPEGEGLDDSQTLLTIDLTDESKYQYTAGEDLYSKGEEGNRTPITDYTACYMLPLNAANDANTFTVEIYGVENSDGTGNVEEGDKETLLKSFTVQNKDENATKFNIRSNYIYCIGKKAEGMDDPISLGDDVILLEVQDWIPINHAADLGATRVQALFDDTENEIHNCINHEFTLKVLPPSILLKGKVESIKVYTEYMDELTYGLNTDGNFVSILGDETMKGEEEDVAKAQQLYGKDWLYVKQSGDTYDKTLDLTNSLTPGGESCEISLFMEDYARPRKSWGWKVEGLQEGEYSWQGTANDIDYINKDYRYVNIVLETKFIWDNQEYIRYDRMPIKQYNTITVFYNPQNGENKYTCCGFSREDVNKDLYPANMYAWGWRDDNNTIENTSIYKYGTGDLYNGLENIRNIGYVFSANWSKWWLNEWKAPREAQHLFRKIENKKMINAIGSVDGSITKVTERDDLANVQCWYLPAQYEMEGLMTLKANNVNGKINTNIMDDLWYWTSTLPDNSIVGFGNAKGNAIGWKYDTNKGKYVWVYEDGEEGKEARFNAYLIRQARRFPEEYEYAW